jgi:hypothetical protein
MGATVTFRFLEYTLRPAEAFDRTMAEQWTKADPYHPDVNPEFWIEQAPDRDSYLLLDEQGALFFWKGILIGNGRMEMHIQFCPMPGDRPSRMRLRKRIRAGLRCGLTWLMQMLHKAGEVKEVYFDSSSDALTTFAVKHLGFVKDGARMRKRLAGHKRALMS